MILQSMYEAQQLNFTLAWRHSNSIKGNMHMPAAHTDVRRKRRCCSIVYVTDVVEGDGSKLRHHCV